MGKFKNSFIKIDCNYVSKNMFVHLCLIFPTENYSNLNWIESNSKSKLASQNIKEVKPYLKCAIC
jgi:hypothetical protein